MPLLGMGTRIIKLTTNMEKITTRQGLFFICTVASNRAQEDGSEKRVKEQYCISAETFGDAEEKALEVSTGSDVAVIDVSRAPFSTIYIPKLDDEMHYYRVKIKTMTVEESTNKLKVTPVTVLVAGTSTSHAGLIAKLQFDATMMDYETVSVIQTAIEEII